MAAAVRQRKVPVVVTFHGSDIRRLPINVLSTLASGFAA